MTLLVNVRLEGSRGIIDGNFGDLFDEANANRLLRDAVDDIADAVEQEAINRTPVESGRLKLHPVDREESRFGVATDVSAFGGGVSIRGAGGRFVGATPQAGAGQIVFRVSMTIPEEPEYAKFVHEGTGIFGPNRKPYTAKTPGKYMVFNRWSKARSSAKRFRFLSIKGQRAQPYLREAFLQIEGSYVPARIQLLREQIAAET